MLLEAPHLANRSGVRAGFTTREGGVSEGALASLNLALRGGEAPERVVENWQRVAHALGAFEAAAVATLHQVHGAVVVHVTAPGGPLQPVAEADAAWTTERGVILAVRVADCVPVLVAGERGIAVIHAGWRGAAVGVVPAAIAALCAGAGEDPGALSAAVGPCISAARFEVGPEVVAALATTGLDPDVFSHRGPGGRPHVDLAGIVAAQLASAGVGYVERLDVCTVDDPRFFSHRRDGEGAGRSAGVIVRRPG